MTVFLERVDAVPLVNLDFPFEFMQWLSILTDQINETFSLIQENINLNQAQSYTAAEITALAAGGLPDGVILYDTTNNVYVGKANGTLVQFDTSAYP